MLFLMQFYSILVGSNSQFVIDIPRFLDMFWVAVYISDLQFGATAGASITPLDE
jgi:hypothetical protein